MKVEITDSLETNNSDSKNGTNFDQIDTSTLTLAIVIATINLFFVFLTTFLLLRRIIRLRQPLQLYIQNIVFCNFFVAGGHLMGAVRYLVKYSADMAMIEKGADDLCLFQSIVTTFANLATFFWMVMIEWSACRLMLKKPAPLKYGSWFLHLMCWLVPAIIVTFAIVRDILGEDLDLSGPGYCWIKHGSDWRSHLMWGLLCAKGWELIAIFATVNFYFFNRCYFNRRAANDIADMIMSNASEAQLNESEEIRLERKADEKDLLWECRGIALLPLNLMILRIWGTTRFWIDISIEINGSNEQMQTASLGLLKLQTMGDSCLALFNFMLLAAVKWSQLTEAFPWLRHIRPCQWLSNREEFDTSIESSKG